MKITVLGAGAIGSAIACDLASRSEVTHVLVVDQKVGALRALAERIGSPKLRTARADVRDERRLAAVLAGSACVVSSVDPSLHFKLARLALSVGAHFCDLGGDEARVRDELALTEEAAARSRWIVPNCGLAPGFVNVLATQLVETVEAEDGFEAIEAVVVRAGNIPVEAEEPFFHRLAYGAEKLIRDYTTPAVLVEHGEPVEVEALSGLEAVEGLFGPPFEHLEAFHTSGKLSTLSEDLAPRIGRLDYKTLRHPGHAAAIKSVLALGFGEKQTIDVRTHLSYRDVLARRMRQRLGGDYRDAVLLRVEVAGQFAAGERRLVATMTVEHDAEADMSAMQRCTGFPAAVIAMLLGSGAVPGGGAAPPERIVPKDAFFEALAERGMHVTTRWADEA